MHKRATMHEKSSLLHKIRGEINQFIYVLNDFGSHKHCLLLVPSLIFDFGTFLRSYTCYWNAPHPSCMTGLCAKGNLQCALKNLEFAVFFLFSDVF